MTGFLNDPWVKNVVFLICAKQQEQMKISVQINMKMQIKSEISAGIRMAANETVATEPVALRSPLRAPRSLNRIGACVCVFARMFAGVCVHVCVRACVSVRRRVSSCKRTLRWHCLCWIIKGPFVATICACIALGLCLLCGLSPVAATSAKLPLLGWRVMLLPLFGLCA